MTKKNKRLTGLFVAGCLLAAVIAVAVPLLSSGVLGKKDKMCEGITIDTLEVGGMTKQEAEQKLEQYITDALEKPVTITVADHEIQTSVRALGMQCDDRSVLDDAFRVGKTGNIWKQYKEQEEVRKNGKTFSIPFTFSKDTLRDFVETECSKYDVKAKNSKLSLKNGKFVASKERTGHEVQVDKTIAQIEKELTKADTKDNLTIQAVVEDTEPKYTKEMVSKCQDLLGSYSTSYATSTAARATNVQTAAGRINGTILYPGQTFSTIKVIKDRTEANGYQVASEYSSGKVVDGVGGGVCQVSTTLYNAVINAELEVVERSPHSMVVSYVDVSRDAAISGDYKDFKFKNNTEAPIYIASTAESGNLSFRIYGEETREEGRTIEFKSEILETIEPGADKEVVDKTKPASYREVTQSAHVGYKAQLWKIVKVNGKQTEKIQLNSSTYSAEPRYVTVGAGSKPKSSAKPDGSAKPSATPKPKKTKDPKATPKASAIAKPKKTATPKPTQTAAAE